MTTDSPETEIAARKTRFDLFMASVFMLFLELTFIRWIPGNVRMLSFFSNFVLLACFLGISVGFLVTHWKSRFILITTAVLAVFALLFYFFPINMQLDPGTSQRSVYYGAEIKVFLYQIPFPFILISMIFLIVLAFVGPGQVVGKLFEGLKPLEAYLINISGSIVGTLIFALFSSLNQPPVSWFAFLFILLLFLIKHEKLFPILANLLLVLVTLVTVNKTSLDSLWSPYSKITLSKEGENRWGILVNGLSHQYARPREELVFSGYQIPFLLKLRSAHPSFQDILIIGSGMGNDVSLALYFNAQNIDAVEIDPVIYQLGKMLHPEKPYDDPRVKIHIMDGRQFLNAGGKKYNLILYALVDSLSLFSSFSAVRLENHLFTKEAFGEARNRLKPDGIIVVYNYFRRGWVVEKAERAMREAFGGNVMVLTFPVRETIDMDEDIGESPLVLILAGNVDSIKKGFEDSPDHRFLIWTKPYEKNLQVNGFYDRLESESKFVFPGGISTLTGALPSQARSRPVTDDWPFPYLRCPGIPPHYIKGIVILLIISMIFIFVVVRKDIKNFSFHYFFLGAGFMLLETVGVIRFSQLYGSTWLNNAVVFTAILFMSLVANIYMLRREVTNVAIVYVMLCLAVLINFIIGPSLFMESKGFVKYIVPPAVLFLPVLFAGIVFAYSFKKEAKLQGALASNILGAMAGGMLEYLSMWIGYTLLLGVVLFFYLLSWITLRRRAGG